MAAIFIERVVHRRANAPVPIVLAAAIASALAACGGDSNDDEAPRAQALRANQPVIITSYGPNPVSVWSEIAFATGNAPASSAG